MDLVVVEQTDTVKGAKSGNDRYRATISVDVPVDGPQALVDSVMVIINHETYHFFELCFEPSDDDSVTFREDEMYTNDGETLLAHYMEKYRPLLSDFLLTWFNLTLKLEVQTDRYVTYGLECYHCGASCGSEKYYYTFDKQDGHLVRGIISHENLVRFFKDHPDYSKQEEYLWEFSPEKAYTDLCYGLLDDHFSLVILGWYNHYFIIDVPYSQISSYLSSEVQKLVEQKKDNHGTFN